MERFAKSENGYLYHTYYLRQFFCGKGNNYFWKQQTYQGFFLRKNHCLFGEKNHCSFRKEALLVLGNANSIKNPPAQCRDKSEILQGGYII